MCAMHYDDNRCDPDPVPAMRLQCATWKTCMKRDPATVGRLQAGGELFAENINSFVKHISWRTFVSSVVDLE